MWTQPGKDGLQMTRFSLKVKGVNLNQFKSYMCDMENQIKEMDQEGHYKEFTPIDRNPDNTVKTFYMRQKMTGMSEREMVGKIINLP